MPACRSCFTCDHCSLRVRPYFHFWQAPALTLIDDLRRLARNPSRVRRGDQPTHLVNGRATVRDDHRYPGRWNRRIVGPRGRHVRRVYSIDRHLLRPIRVTTDRIATNVQRRGIRIPVHVPQRIVWQYVGIAQGFGLTWVRGVEANGRNLANMSMVYDEQIRGVCLSRGRRRRRLLDREDLLRH